MSDRLLRFDTDDACGQWNSTLMEDFRSDSEFIRAADELFRIAVAEHTRRECITSDGLSLEAATIELGTSISLHFRLQFLDAPDGCWDAPAQFSVASGLDSSGVVNATLSCGLCEPDGDFWYPRNRRMTSVILGDDYNWAFRRTRSYGPPTISSWMQRRYRSCGEP